MKTKLISLISFALAAFFTTPCSSLAAVVYSDSGSAGSGTSYVNGSPVSYDSADWEAYYDDDQGGIPFAVFAYTLHTGGGDVVVVAIYGGPPPPGNPAPSWTFWGNTDNLAAGHPDFLDAFWLVAP